MLTEARQDFFVELGRCDGGLGVLPCPPSVPKAHRFQGGLIYSRMIDIRGQVLAPQALAGRPMRIWLSQLQKWHFSRTALPYLGTLSDRTNELPGGGLEASLYIPEAAWLPAVECLGSIWKRLKMTGADGDGFTMTLVDFSFSSDEQQPT